MNDANFTAYILDQLSAAERATVEAASRDENVTRSMRDTAQLSRLLREHRAAEPKLEASATLMLTIHERANRQQANHRAEVATVVDLAPQRSSFWRSTMGPVALAASVLLNVVALTYLLTREATSVRLVERETRTVDPAEIPLDEAPLEMLASSVPRTEYSVRALPQEPPIALDPSVAVSMGIDTEEPSQLIDRLERRQSPPRRAVPMGQLGSVATAPHRGREARDNSPLGTADFATSSTAPRKSRMTYGPPVVGKPLDANTNQFSLIADIPSIAGDALAGIIVAEPRPPLPTLKVGASQFGHLLHPNRLEYAPNTTGERPSVYLGRVLGTDAIEPAFRSAMGDNAPSFSSIAGEFVTKNANRVPFANGSTYSGGTIIVAGGGAMINLSHPSASPSQVARVDSSIVQFAGAMNAGHSASTLPSLGNNGGGTLNLSGENAYTGGATITSGTIRVTNGTLAADASAANGTNNLSFAGSSLDVAPQLSARQSSVGSAISDASTTTLSPLAVSAHAANAPSPAARSTVDPSRGTIIISAGTIATHNVELQIAGQDQYGWKQEQVAQQHTSLVRGEDGVERAWIPGHDTPRPIRGNTEAYATIHENPFEKVAKAPLSTFSIDVDTASYSNMRRFLTQRQLPPADAVRIEELLNYFTYNYPQPKGDVPFSVTTEVARCPWNTKHQLVRIGLRGREIAAEDRPASNLVFLIDVSGSMADQNKLPLVKQGMRMLTRQLTERDHVAIVVYAGASGLVLPSTPGDQKETILDTLGKLQSGGSTNGGSGLQLAYSVASEHMIRGGINRVILCTDGDFNVGMTDRDELVSMIEAKAKSGVQLSVLGFGMGNYKDATLEKLADKGDGNYAYIDTELEARKVLVDQLSATLITIAKDVKIQIEFNPSRVAAYRLLGYENRVMAAEDFNNDKKDAGEIGAGHTVTALYEVLPEGAALGPGVDELKYQPRPAAVVDNVSQELLTLKLRYKLPGEDASKLIETPVKDATCDFSEASKDFKFSASVAAFGMLLRQSRNAGSATLDTVLEWATDGRGSDLDGYREEFLDLVRRAKELKR